jgi:hypothetical protein
MYLFERKQTLFYRTLRNQSHLVTLEHYIGCTDGMVAIMKREELLLMHWERRTPSQALPALLISIGMER